MPIPTERASGRTAPPVGTTAAAAAVHNGVDIPWLSPLDQLHGHLPAAPSPSPWPPGNIKPVFLLQRGGGEGEGERGRERTLFVASRSLVLPGCRGHAALVVQLNSMPD